MSAKYWTGIFVCMLAIFGVGLLVARGVSKAKDFAINTIPSAMPLIMNAGFKLDGDRLGDIQRVQFMRSEPGRVDSAVLSVKLSNPDDIQQLDNCILRVTNAQPFGNQSRFLCASTEDSARLQLVAFGHVVILPQGRELTLFVSGNNASAVRRQAYRGMGGDAGDVDIRTSDGHLSIAVNGKQLINAFGDSNGGGLVIRGADGRPILQINGDSSGGSVKVTDGHGKTVVDIHGKSGKKDTSGGH